MAKSSNADDIKKRSEYEKMDFTEFLEMLGRVAYSRYKDSASMKDKSLDEKLEPILDTIL
jgi:hypothetical protein